MDLTAIGIRADTSKLRVARDELGRFKAGAHSAKASAIGLEGALARLGRAAGVMAVGFLSVAKAREAITQARGFSASMSEAATLIAGTRGEMDLMEASARKLVATYGGTASGKVKAFYQAISAGADGVAGAATLLDQANKLAVGGVTDITTGVDALTTAMNAYGPEVLSAADASDALFVGMKAGKTTVGELGASLGNVIPIASALNVPFDELVGSVAALTTQGQTTSVAVTGVRAILASVVKPTQQAADAAARLGIDFNAAALESKGLAAFLQEVTEKTGGSKTEIGQLFTSIEALNAVLAFSGGAGSKFNAIMDDMAVKAGATDAAFEKVSASLDQRLSVALGRLSNLSLTFGQILLSAAVPAMEAFATGMEFASRNMDILAVGLAALAASRIPAMVAGLGSMTGAMLTAINVARALAVAMWAATGPWGVLAGLVGAAAAAIVIFKRDAENVATPLEEAKAAQEALNTALAAFAGTYSIAAGDAAINAANDYYAKAAAAREAAASNIALLQSELALQQGINQGLQFGNFFGEDEARIIREDLAVATQELAEAERLLSLAQVERVNTAKRVMRADSDMKKALEKTADGVTVTIKGLGDLGTSAGGAAGSVKDLTDAMAGASGSSLTTAVDSLSGAWGDFVVSGFQDFDKFKDAVLNTFKRMLSEMIALAAKNRILIGLGFSASGSAGSAAVAAATSGGSGGGGLLGGLLGNSGLLGGIGSVIGTFGGTTGLLGGLGNVVGGFLGTGGTAGGLSGALAGLQGSLAGATGGIAGFAGAIGAMAIPLAAVALIARGFSRKYTGTAIRGNLGSEGFDGYMFDFYRGGFLTGDRVDYRGVPDEIQTLLDTAMTGTRDAITEMADVLGLGTDAIQDFVDDQFTIWTNGLDEAGIQAALEEQLAATADEMAELVLATDDFTRAGESALDTLTRLSTSIAAVNDMSDLLGHTLWEVSLATADMASDLVDAFGGVENMTAAALTYWNAFYTETERFDTTLRRLRETFGELGVTMPESRESFRLLVEGIDLSTAAGRELYAELISLSGALDEVLPQVAQFTLSMQGLLSNIQSNIQSQIDTASQMASDSRQAAQLWYRTATTLRDFLRNLVNSDLSAASPAQAFNVNRNRFNTAFEMARGGDVQAAQDIPGLAQAYLASLRATATSGVEYRRAASQVQSQLQFLAGIADLEGANDDILTSLYEQQIEVLTALGNFLHLEGITGDDFDALSADLQALVGDWDGTIADFDDALASLETAIREGEAFSYDNLVDNLTIAIDAASSADIPAYLQTMIENAGDGILVALDFIVRSDLSAPDKWLATNSLSEHIKTIQFIADETSIAPGLAQLALATSSQLRRNISFFLTRDIDDETRTIALAGNSELSRIVNVALDETRSDPDALLLALRNVHDYGVVVEASFGTSITEDVRRIVLTQSGGYAAMIQASLTQLRGDTARRILLRQQGDYVTNIAGILSGNLRPELRRLLLNANTEAVRAVTISAAFAGTLSATDRALLTDTGATILRTIEGVVNPAGISALGHLFLQQIAETGDVRRVLDARIWTRDINAVGMAILTQLDAGAGDVRRDVNSRLNALAMNGPAKTMLELLSGSGNTRRDVLSRVQALPMNDPARVMHDLLTSKGNERKDLLSRLRALPTDNAGRQMFELLTVNGDTRKDVLSAVQALPMGSTAQVMYDLLTAKGSARRDLKSRVEALSMGPAATTMQRLLTGTGDVRRDVNARVNSLAMSFDGRQLYGLLTNATDARADVNSRVNVLAMSDRAATMYGLLTEKGDVRRDILSRVTPRAMSDVARQLLGELTASRGVVSRTISASVLAQALAPRAAGLFAQLTAGDGSVARSIAARVDPLQMSPRGFDLYRLLNAGAGAMRQTIDSRVEPLNMSPRGLDLFRILSDGATSIRRIITAGVTLGSGTTALGRDLLDELREGSGTIRRIILGGVSLRGLTGAQRALLDAISGTTTGTITLGGTFRFEPSTAFSTWFGSTTRNNITAPMNALRGMLDQLRNAVDADRQQRESAARIIDITTQASRLSGAVDQQRDRAERLVTGLRALEASTGVTLGMSDGSPGTLELNADGTVNLDWASLVYTQGNQAGLDRFRNQFNAWYAPQIASANAAISDRLDILDSLRAQVRSLGAVPAFAMGGYHMGGARLVGEAGPEIEVTGPSRVYSNSQSRSMLDNREVVAELRRLNKRMDQFQDQQRQLGLAEIKHGKRAADVLDKSDRLGMPVRNPDDGTALETN